MADNNVNDELDKLRSDVTELREDVQVLINAMKEAGLQRGREFYDRAAERARHAGETVRERAGEAYGSIEKEVEARPFTSILAAFGTGFVVGMLLDRRHH